MNVAESLPNVFYSKKAALYFAISRFYLNLHSVLNDIQQPDSIWPFFEVQ